MESLVFGDPITEESLKSKPEYANKKLTSTDIAQIALDMKNAGGKNIAALNHAKSLTDKLGIKNEEGLLRSNVVSRSANDNNNNNNNKGMATFGGDNVRRYGAFKFNTNNKSKEEEEEEMTFKGKGVATVGVIYNATGNTLTYVTSHDYDGTHGPFPYPKTLKNGQWGVFVHKNTPGSITGSRAAIVFRGQKEEKKGCVCSLVQRDWVMAWDNPGDIQVSGNGSAEKKAYTEIREPARYDDQSNLLGDISNKLTLSGHICSAEFDDCWSYVSIGDGDDDSSTMFEAIMTVNKG